MASADVVHSGYLRKQKTSHRRFFVLRSASAAGPARLEAWDSEKRFRDSLQKRRRDGGANVSGDAAAADKPRSPRLVIAGGGGSTGGGSSWHAPRRSLELAQCVAVSRGADARHRHLLLLFTAEQRLAVAADSEEALAAWFGAVQQLRAQVADGPDGRGDCSSAREVWQVSVRARGLGAPPCGLAGAHRLCLWERSLALVPVGAATTAAAAAAVTLQLLNIRRCGHSDNYFFMEVGRSAVTGEGELWMAVDDAVVAQRMHDTILTAMKSLSSAGSPLGGPAEPQRAPAASAGAPSPVAATAATTAAAATAAAATTAAAGSRLQPVAASAGGPASPTRRSGGPWRRRLTGKKGGVAPAAGVAGVAPPGPPAAPETPARPSAACGSLSDGGFASSSDESGSCVSPGPGEAGVAVATPAPAGSRTPIRRTVSLSAAAAGGGGGDADRKAAAGRACGAACGGGGAPCWLAARSSVASLDELSPARRVVPRPGTNVVAETAANVVGKSVTGVGVGVGNPGATLASVSSSLGSVSPKSSSSLSDQAFLDDDVDDDDDDEDDDDDDDDYTRARGGDDGGYVSMQPGVALGRRAAQPQQPQPQQQPPPQSDYVPMMHAGNSSNRQQPKNQRRGGYGPPSSEPRSVGAPSAARRCGAGGRGANAGYVLMTPSPDAAAAFPWPPAPALTGGADGDDDYMSMAPAGLDVDDYGGGGGGGGSGASPLKHSNRPRSERRRCWRGDRNDANDESDAAGPYCYHSLPRSLRPTGSTLHRTASLNAQQQAATAATAALAGEPRGGSGIGGAAALRAPQAREGDRRVVAVAVGPRGKAALMGRSLSSQELGGGVRVVGVGGGVGGVGESMRGVGGLLRVAGGGDLPRVASAGGGGGGGAGRGETGTAGGCGGGRLVKGATDGPGGSGRAGVGEMVQPATARPFTTNAHGDNDDHLGGDYVQIHYGAAAAPNSAREGPLLRAHAASSDYTEMEMPLTPPPCSARDGLVARAGRGRRALHYAALDLGDEGQPGGLLGEGGAGYASIDFQRGARGEKGPRAERGARPEV